MDHSNVRLKYTMPIPGDRQQAGIGLCLRVVNVKRMGVPMFAAGQLGGGSA
jgi:hypothetical protein